MPVNNWGVGQEQRHYSPCNAFDGYFRVAAGVYALVMNVEASRIGFNDVSRAYVLDESERKQRLNTLLKSITFTLLSPKGAHRNTQFPHVVSAEGVVAVSWGTVPAPTASPLNVNYADELQAISQQVNRFAPGGVETFSFKSLSEFAKIMADLAEKL